MGTFRQDLSEARQAELKRALARLMEIGDESERIKTFPQRRADAVREAIDSFTREELPLSIIAGLVDLSYEWVRQIANDRVGERALEDTMDL